jgi:hypothetical protein
MGTLVVVTHDRSAADTVILARRRRNPKPTTHRSLRGPLIVLATQVSGVT